MEGIHEMPNGDHKNWDRLCYLIASSTGFDLAIDGGRPARVEQGARADFEVFFTSAELAHINSRVALLPLASGDEVGMIAEDNAGASLNYNEVAIPQRSHSKVSAEEWLGIMPRGED